MSYYYGDPEILRRFNLNSKTFGDDFEQEVEAFNAVVEPLMEADLLEVFDLLPEKTSKTTSVLSTLWVYAMTEHIQLTKGSTQRTAATQFSDKQESKYQELLAKIKAGETMVKGARRRRGTRPASAPYTPTRVAIEDRDAPVILDDLNQRGLRQ